MSKVGSTVLTVMLSLGWVALDPRAAVAKRSSATVAECSDARAREEFRVTAAAAVDGFVVDARGGKTTVKVSAGGFERVLRLSGDGARGLRFAPALEGDVFTVTVEREAGACLEKLTLLGGKTTVAVVTP